MRNTRGVEVGFAHCHGDTRRLVRACHRMFRILRGVYQRKADTLGAKVRDAFDGRFTNRGHGHVRCAIGSRDGLHDSRRRDRTHVVRQARARVLQRFLSGPRF